MVARYPTRITRRVPPNPCTLLYPSNPTHNSGSSTNAPDHSIAPLLANDPRLTGAWGPLTIPTTLKYYPADSLRPCCIIGTLFPLPALDLLPREPTTPAPHRFPPPDITLSSTPGQKYPDESLEDWAHRLLNFNDQGAAGRLLESVREDLRQNTFMRNKLQNLVDEIHVSPNPGTFEDPADPARSFHIQRGALSHPGDASRIPGQRNQEEQNTASATLHALNPGGGLFEQPAACTIGLSARQRANSVPSAVRMWGQAVRKNPGGALPPRPPRDKNACSDDTLCYIDPPAPPWLEPASFHHERPPHFDLCQTRGRDAPPPPAHRLFNRGPPRTTPGPPSAPTVPRQAPPAGPPLGPPPLLPQPPQGPPRPPPERPPAPPPNPGNQGGPPLPPQWNPGPPPGGAGPLSDAGPPGRGPPGGWGPAMGAFPLPQGGNHYYYYYNARPPPRNPGPPDDDCDALAREGKLDIQRPESFTGWDPRRWRTFLIQCLNLFQAKPVTFQLDNTCVAFAASYLQGIAFNHYTALLQFEPQSPILSNWQSFVNKFLTKFRVFNTVVEAKDNLFNLRMRSDERFTTFIVRFKKEAYETGWNYNVLRYALRRAFPQRIKDVLRLAPKQPMYEGYKVLVMQVDQRYWEDHSEYSNTRTQWNAGGQTWQPRAPNSAANPRPPNPAPPTTPGTRPPFIRNPIGNNQSPGPRPPAQLNASNTIKAPEPNPDQPIDPDTPVNDSTLPEDEEAL
ncbi:hypothetical protein C0992_006810 [Termitomyces sp. T32_za158]|nr:hypothetical protein C0992_006810 [Termitomyces sp. T32_za158]